MKNRLLFLAALIAGLALVGPAHAQDRGGTVSRVQFDLDGWLYVPTLSSSGARVESFVALRLDGTQTGENITSVWFRRGSNAWRVVAWENSQSQAQVIRHVKDALAIGDRYDYLWPIPPAAEAAAEPLVFANGVLADDAMRVAIESGSDPRGFLSDLVQAGYKAALLEPEIVDLAQQCVEHDVLNIIAEGVELELTKTEETRGEGIVALQDNLATLACITICWDWDYVIGGPTCTGCTTTGWALCGTAGVNCPSGYGIIADHLHCAMMCWFKTTLNCTWTRTMQTVNWDCTTCTWTQTGTSSETLYRKSTTYVDYPCTLPPPGFTCPAGPDDPTVACGDQLSGPGNWTPPSPCD